MICDSVHSLGFLGSIGAGLQNVFGGEVSQTTSIISDGRHESEAQKHGAYGITSELRHSNASWPPGTTTTSTPWSPGSDVHPIPLFIGLTQQ